MMETHQEEAETNTYTTAATISYRGFPNHNMPPFFFLSLFTSINQWPYVYNTK